MGPKKPRQSQFANGANAVPSCGYNDLADLVEAALKRLASAVRFRPWPPCFRESYKPPETQFHSISFQNFWSAGMSLMDELVCRDEEVSPLHHNPGEALHPRWRPCSPGLLFQEVNREEGSSSTCASPQPASPGRVARSACPGALPPA